VIVQDPQSAEFKGMPEAAVQTGIVDSVVPLEDISEMIRSLVAAGRS
jgi:two-component system chemotaxis response regulator CheB